MFCYCKNNGLCNRIIYLIAARAISRIKDIKIPCYWKSGFDCDIEWASLFINRDWIRPGLPEKIKLEKISVGKVWFDQFFIKYLHPKYSWNIFLTYILEEINLLEPAFKANNIIQTLALPKEYVAVHIRFTDNIPFMKSQNKTFSKRMGRIRDYIGVIDFELGKNECVFVATDNLSIQKRIVSIFPERVKFLQKPWKNHLAFVLRKDLKLWKMVRKKRMTPENYALADLIILSKAKRLYGTYFSSFSKFAAVMGRINDFYFVSPTGPVPSLDVQMMVGEGDPFNGDVET